MMSHHFIIVVFKVWNYLFGILKRLFHLLNYFYSISLFSCLQLALTFRLSHYFNFRNKLLVYSSSRKAVSVQKLNGFLLLIPPPPPPPHLSLSFCDHPSHAFASSLSLLLSRTLTFSTNRARLAATQAQWPVCLQVLVFKMIPSNQLDLDIIYTHFLYNINAACEKTNLIIKKFIIYIFINFWFTTYDEFDKKKWLIFTKHF